MKAPRGRFQSIADGVDRQRTGAARRVANASPVSAHSSAVAEAVASAAIATYSESMIDLFTLASDGAQDLTLTYLPKFDSWNVSISGVTLTDGVGYTVSGQTLSLLTAADARTGETVVIQYDYLTGQAQPSGEPFSGLIESLGPLVWYRVGDVSNGGTMTDSSGHAHHGVWNSVTSHGLTTSLVGDSDQALLMTGAAGEGGRTTSASWMNLTSDLTWVVFFKSADNDGRLFAREQTSGGGQDWSLQLTTGRVHFCAGGSVVASSLTSGLDDNAAHLALYTYDGSNIRIYVDGVLDKLQSYSTPLGTAAYDLTVGYGGGTSSNSMFTGVLDEVIMFDRVLTDTEVAAIWDAAT